MVFSLFVDSLKRFFEQTKSNCFKKMSKCLVFFTLTVCINIELPKAKFDAGWSYKVSNQFLLQNLFLRIIAYGIK